MFARALLGLQSKLLYQPLIHQRFTSIAHLITDMPRTSAKQRIRALAYDEQLVVRAGLQSLLESSEIKLQTSDSWADFCRELARSQSVDVVCMDPSTQGRRDIELITQAQRHLPGARILIYSAFEDVPFISSVYEAGAQGFISKRADRNLLLKALREVARGDVFYAPQFAAELAHYHTAEQHQHPRNLLTDRELQIFIALALGESKLSIARSLGIELKSVQNRTVTIKLKLGVPREHFERLALFYGLIEMEGSSRRTLRRVRSRDALSLVS